MFKITQGWQNHNDIMIFFKTSKLLHSVLPIKKSWVNKNDVFKLV